MLAAWQTSKLMNMWRDAKSPIVTAAGLLGPEFFKDEPSKFKDKAAWEYHKKEIFKMAKFHEKVLGQIKSGQREAKVVKNPAKELK